MAASASSVLVCSMHIFSEAEEDELYDEKKRKQTKKGRFGNRRCPTGSGFESHPPHHDILTIL